MTTQEERYMKKLLFIDRWKKTFESISYVQWFPKSNTTIKLLAIKAREEIGYSNKTISVDIVYHLEDIYKTKMSEIKKAVWLRRKIDFVKENRVFFDRYSLNKWIFSEDDLVLNISALARKELKYQDYSKSIDIILHLIEIYNEHVKSINTNKMIKIIKKTNEMTVDTVQSLLDQGKLGEYFIFYYSQNKDYPVFLKQCCIGGYEFNAPLFNRKGAYQGLTIVVAIEKAQKTRDVYIVHRDDYSDIFKPCPNISCK